MTSTSLITVSVATFVFALVTALSAIDVGGKDALAATAAYTAVLVVIIGTSTSSNAGRAMSLAIDYGTVSR